MRMLLKNCLLAMVLLMGMPAYAQAPAQALPVIVGTDVPAAKTLTPLGEGTMRFFGLRVYDVQLWTAMKPFSYQDAFALELVYHMSLKGRDIAERSVKEMRGQGYSDEAKLKRWGDEMARIFPDIAKGDTLIGVNVPDKEARFYSRDKFIATVPDPEFAKAFFDIWMSEKTSAPGVREKLLGTAAK
ncbi:MAG: chalcone isomerase family protein [Betaproteobacteria bacterium]